MLMCITTDKWTVGGAHVKSIVLAPASNWDRLLLLVEVQLLVSLNPSHMYFKEDLVAEL